MRTITVVIDSETRDECLYVDGKAWAAKGETTVFATDIAEVAEEVPIVFRHVGVVCPDGWPDNLADLQRVDGNSWDDAR